MQLAAVCNAVQAPGSLVCWKAASRGTCRARCAGRIAAHSLNLKRRLEVVCLKFRTLPRFPRSRPSLRRTVCHGWRLGWSPPQVLFQQVCAQLGSRAAAALRQPGWAARAQLRRGSLPARAPDAGAGGTLKFAWRGELCRRAVPSSRPPCVALDRKEGLGIAAAPPVRCSGHRRPPTDAL